jgi:hypothetical protein
MKTRRYLFGFGGKKGGKKGGGSKSGT